MNNSIGAVLYAEDSDDDAFLMQRAFEQVNFPGSLVVVPDGVEAIRYLAGQGAYANRDDYPDPCLILLDLKMPRLDGLGVLEWVRKCDRYRDTPVLMLTSSSQEKDVANAYEKGVNGYLLKPTDLNRFRELVEDLVRVCQARQAGLSLEIRGALRPREPDVLPRK